MAKLVLFGCGRGASVAYRFISKDTNHEVVGFAVDEKYRKADVYMGLPLVPFEDVERHFPPDTHAMHILLGYQGMNRLRETKFNEAKAKGYRLESYVASNIFRVEPIKYGENCFILDNQSISLDVEIGDNVVMWSSNHVGDCSRIGDHAWVSSHVTIAASVEIGARCFLGVGATLANGAHIGESAFVGAHTLVSSPLPDRAVTLHGQDSGGIDALAFMRIMMASKKL